MNFLMQDNHLMIALVAAMVNIILSILLPSLLQSNTDSLSTKIKANYQSTNTVVFTSSILTMIFVFISLKITPYVNNNIFKNLARIA